MKRAALFCLLLGIALNGWSETNECEGGVCPLPMQGEAPPRVNSTELEVLIAGGNAVVIDTRPYASSRIPKSVVLTGEPTAEEVAKVIPSKETTVVTYCGSLNCHFSLNMALHLKSLGYTDVREYPAGLKGWKRGGRPVEAVQ